MIYGYSERGMINSIVYYLDDNKELIGGFLGEVLDIKGFDCKTHEFTFLVEQSFSDFGDCDLTIIAENLSHKTVIFVEAKVKTYNGQYSLKKKYEELKQHFKYNTSYKENSFSSTVFIQLYNKYLLSTTGKDEITIKDKRFESLWTKLNRKIGENKIVTDARDKYIKSAEDYYFVALLPDNQLSATLRIYFKNLGLDIPSAKIKCSYWGKVEEFFTTNKADVILENFGYNKGQIY